MNHRKARRDHDVNKESWISKRMRTKDSLMQGTGRDYLLLDDIDKVRAKQKCNPIEAGAKDRQNNRRHRVISHVKALSLESDIQQETRLTPRAEPSYHGDTRHREHYRPRSSSGRKGREGQSKDNSQDIPSDFTIKDSAASEDWKKCKPLLEHEEISRKKPIDRQHVNWESFQEMPLCESNENKRERRHRSGPGTDHRGHSSRNYAGKACLQDEKEDKEKIRDAKLSEQKPTEKSKKLIRERPVDCGETERCRRSSKSRVAEISCTKRSLQQPYQNQTFEIFNGRKTGSPEKQAAHERVCRSALDKSDNKDRMNPERQALQKHLAEETSGIKSRKSKSKSNQQQRPPPDAHTSRHRRSPKSPLARQDMFTMSEINNTNGDYFRYPGRISPSTTGQGRQGEQLSAPDPKHSVCRSLTVPG